MALSGEMTSFNSLVTHGGSLWINFTTLQVCMYHGSGEIDPHGRVVLLEDFPSPSHILCMYVLHQKKLSFFSSIFSLLLIAIGKITTMSTCSVTRQKSPNGFFDFGLMLNPEKFTTRYVDQNTSHHDNTPKWPPQYTRIKGWRYGASERSDRLPSTEATYRYDTIRYDTVRYASRYFIISAYLYSIIDLP